MKSVDQHLADILATVRPLAPLEVELESALGTTLAEEIISPVPLPPFNNSAMDGYAVRAVDVADVPVTLPVIDDVAAGAGEMLAIGPGHAARIMTGGPMPAGADAVVPVEWTDGGKVSVRVDRAAEVGNAIRLAGEDVRAGDTVLRPGAVIGPAQLGIIAGVGRRRVLVRPRPRVVVLATGAELVEPGLPLGHGQIWDSNSFTLTAAVREAGGDGFRAPTVGDDPAAFLEQLDAQLVRADAVITSGGVSMGAYEPVKQALGPLGTVRFEKVAMQPGMPQGFGVVGDDQVPVFALPGNPVSSFVSFMLFVRPALRRMRGLEAGLPATVAARLTADVRSPAGKRSFLRGRLAGGTVEPVHGQGSHQLAALASADTLIVVPEEVTAVAAGEEVRVIRL
ncbi:molybdotransferase-like divisome protein Glp [Nonomuraea sp. SBT364]|uniref:molybdotransferase-like divisome protein Glp n=1 Tax=Nonomuraea sp. SBT364 TaxID=1580530 RepID=UPI00066E0302|nr:gephyrin-like molybdotransferase Glp [Nonomuraea sp. SBT364]